MLPTRNIVDPKEFFRVLPFFFSFADCDMIQQAWKLADEKYGNCVSKNGDPFVMRLRKTAAFLIYDHADDAVVVVSGLLNSILEDTDTTEEEIQISFGEEVVFVLNEISGIHRASREKMPAEEKLELLSAKDRRAVWVFLADRYVQEQMWPHETCDYVWVDERNKDYEVYIPLAEHFSFGRLADSFRLLQPEMSEEQVKEPLLRTVPDTVKLPGKSAEACRHFDKAEESFADGRFAEAQEEYEQSVQLCPPDDGTLRIHVLEGLVRCIRKKNSKDIRAVAVYREILQLIEEYHQDNTEQYWREICAMNESLGRCLMTLRKYSEAKNALLAAVSACEQYVCFTKKKSLDMVSRVYFSLGVLYSLDDSTLAESEAVMLRVWNARRELCRRKHSEDNLQELKEVLTALADLSAWMGKSPDVYDRELEIVKKRLKMLERNTPKK